MNMDEPNESTVDFLLKPYESPVESMSNQQLEDAGFMMPIADPRVLRAALKERQRMLTSIMDPETDFLYTVKYTDSGGKQQQKLFTSPEAAKNAVTFLKGTLSAHPKKSGCLKLALALGIESKEVRTEGLPGDQRATYSSSHFISTHKRSGRVEEGQGYCDRAEKPDAKNFAIISMANTRAMCHAILRCAGVDVVGADELDFTETGDSVLFSYNVPPVREQQPMAALSSSAAEVVIPEPVAAPAAVQTAAKATSAPTPAAAAPAAPAATAPSVPTSAPTAQSVQAARPEDTAASAPIPGSGELVSGAMAGILSERMLAALGSRPVAVAWLKDNLGVERSLYVYANQYEKALAALNEIIAEKETK